MTTIPNLNLVFQQSGNALRVMTVQQQAMGQGFFMEGQAQQLKNAEKRTTVNEFEESGKSRLDNETSGHGGKSPADDEREREADDADSEDADLPKSTGRLLNTVV
ncbi:MAG: hypothetical protein CSA22_09060 [Deltaproteobacteria bacterium]|nr:MAG: hypothetical protein CSA22_09060 [Deltaproteobacteria bacterium]